MRRHLPARWKPAAAVLLTAALFLPLLILGGPAFARSGAAASEYEYSGSSQYQYRMVICHHTHSRKHPFVQITISSRAWKAHSRHGDTQGTCPASGQTRTNHHGSSDEHANSHGNKGSDDQSQADSTNASGSHGGGHGHGKP